MTNHKFIKSIVFSFRRLKSLVISHKSHSGFTLMELIVASALFIVVMSIATGSFVRALKNQRDVKDLTSANNNVSQVLEAIAREVRTGSDFTQSTDEQLNFTNYRSERVSYKLLDDNTIGRCLSGLGFCLPEDTYVSLTSKNYPISALKFYYQGIDDSDGLSPRITVSITIEGLKDQDITLQTTVSSKNIGT